MIAVDMDIAGADYHGSMPAETPDEDADKTARRLLSHIGHGGVRCVRARDGREHHLFRVQLPDGERLLKFPRVDALADPYDATRKPADRLRAEAHAIKLVKGPNVPNPYVIFDTDPVCSLMGVIPGTTAEIAWEKNQLDEESLINVCIQMGKTLAYVHTRKRPEGGDLLPDLPDSDLSTARLLHLDFHIGNCVGRPQLGGHWQVLGVVDWTCARWGPVEADLVEMQVSVWVFIPRARDAFVAGYRQASGRALSIKDIERRATFEIHRRLVFDPPESEKLKMMWLDWVDDHSE